MKKTTILILLSVSFLLRATGQGKETPAYINLEPYDFHMTWLREDKALLIDVREPFEYRRNRIKDAINMPSQAALNSLTDTLDRNFCLLFYCSTDYRSKRAAATAAERGFRKVINLDGGIVAWKRDGFPVDRSRLKKKKQVAF